MESAHEPDNRARTVWLGIRRLGGLGVCVGLLLYLIAGMTTLVARDAEWRETPLIIGVLALGVAAVSIVLWLVAAFVAWWLLGPRRWTVFSRRARRESLLALYDDAARVAGSSGLLLLRVRRVYQRAKRGTKAVVEYPDGRQVDAWFWWSAPASGQVLMVRGQTGSGTHHSSSVLYIGTAAGDNGIHDSIPPAAWRAHRRRAT